MALKRPPVALLGFGAIGRYVFNELSHRSYPLTNVLVREGRADAAYAVLGTKVDAVTTVRDLDPRTKILIECAGHEGLKTHGVAALEAGLTVVSVSVGALFDAVLEEALLDAERIGGGKLIFASGAIGALDALNASRMGKLEEVIYTGRKPPTGWRGSHAETIVDLATVTTKPTVHFEGSARDAARLYPKNANVAAAIARAGLGLDETHVHLIADPTVTRNIHRIEARGDFGTFTFEIAGEALPDNPKSSALTAMSVLAEIEKLAGGA